MDIELIKRKITQIDRALNRIKSRLPDSAKDFENNFDAQDIVYRNFQITVQNCGDIGSHIISVKGWRMPKSMGDVFDILGSNRFIPVRLAKDLRETVTVRNIIVHDYARVDHIKSYQLLRKSLKVIPKFCLNILKKTNKSRNLGTNF